MQYYVIYTQANLSSKKIFKKELNEVLNQAAKMVGYEVNLGNAEFFRITYIEIAASHASRFLM